VGTPSGARSRDPLTLPTLFLLREEFLIPLGMSAGALAKTCGVPRTRIKLLASEEAGITADTALRLAKALSTSARLWPNLQNAYDMQTAEKAISKELALCQGRRTKSSSKAARAQSQTMTGVPSDSVRSGRLHHAHPSRKDGAVTVT
jgi:addiction module HigA family antidote